MIKQMLTNVLIPAHIENYYLLLQRVVGIDITKTAVRASRIAYKGRTLTLEKCITQPIEADLSIPYSERVATALSKTLEALQPYNLIKTSLNSSVVIFKELTLPFTNIEKISKIVPFEIEPHLPFPVAQASISFIVTAQNMAQGTTTILAAAVTHEHIAEHINLFTKAGVTPGIIGIDIFDLYSLYHLFQSSASSIPDNVIVIDIDTHVTRILCIIKGQLKFSRILNKGITSVAKTLAQTLDITLSHALDSLVRFGCQDTGKPGYCQAVETTLEEFFKDIRFTIDSFITNLDIEHIPRQVFLMGPGAEPVNIATYAQKYLGIPCTLLEVNQLQTIPHVKAAPGLHVEQDCLMSIATALMDPITATVDMNISSKEHQEQELLTKQLVAAGILIMLIFSLLGLHFWWQSRQLQEVMRQAERSAVTALRNENLAISANLKTALDEAQEAVKAQEEVWFSFSAQTRFSFLKALQTLSTTIDRIGIGLKLQRLSINQRENRLNLTGEVRDFEALKQLERDLKDSDMFVYIKSLQTTKFDIPLLLKNDLVE